MKYNTSGNPSWNKGLTKETDIRVAKLSESKKGRTAWNKGKALSANHRKAISKSHKGKTPWNKGIPMSEEQKKKLSFVKQTKPKVPAHNAKSVSINGKIYTSIRAAAEDIGIHEETLRRKIKRFPLKYQVV